MADGAGKENPGIGRRIETFMGEFRIIIPALGAILGFQLTNAFSQTYAALPLIDRTANFLGLTCTAIALLFLLVPASYHRMTERLDESYSFLHFSQAATAWAFVFIPLSLSLSLYVQAVRSFGDRWLAAGLSLTLFTLFVVAWWVVPARLARRVGTEVRGGGLRSMLPGRSHRHGERGP